MTRFLHLAPERLRGRIARSGLRGRARRVELGEGGTADVTALFAMPLLADHQVTYQWLRELRRWGRSRRIAVSFELPDDEEVLVGRYAEPKHSVRAAEAAAWVEEHPWGAEVVVLSPVAPRAVRWMRDVRQDVGWLRVPPGQHDFECVCPSCVPRGAADLFRRCRAQYNTALEQLHAHGIRLEVDESLRLMHRAEMAAERVAHRLDPRKLHSLAEHPVPAVRRAVVRTLGYFPLHRVAAPLRRRLEDAFDSVALDAARELFRRDALAEAPTALATRPGVLLCLLDERSYDEAPAGLARQLLAELAISARDEATRQRATELREALDREHASGADEEVAT
ncbi:MAG: HEAT repeat domain-containing protein [Myxococcota bacterium]